MNKVINIAIDGPAGAGKSSLSKSIAKELSIIYIDTGALYRAIGIYVLSKNYDTKDEEKVISCLPEINVKLTFENGVQKVILCGEDVSEKIRIPEASMAASNVSKIPKVREFLLSIQRDIAKTNSCIMDGRDIGTVILPDADLKIFLTASAEKRADRRYKELTEKGFEVDYNELLKEIKERDFQDSNREIAPLKPANDAIVLDNSDLDFDQSVKAVIDIVRSNLDVL